MKHKRRSASPQSTSNSRATCPITSSAPVFASLRLYGLKLAAAEVHDAFEVPLDFILDAANHKPRLRTLGDVTLETYDIPYRGRNIWGATAGMLMTLRRLLQEHASPAWRGNS